MMTDAARSAAIAGVERKVEEFYADSTLSSDQVTAKVADYMKTKPEFSQVQTTVDGCVTALFPDGRAYMVVNNRLPYWYKPSGKAPTFAPERSRSASMVVMPTKARLFHSFGLGFEQQQQPIEEMGGWLKSAGYTISNPAEGDARLSGLRTVSGDGFFYFNTHGGSITFPDGEKTYGAGSSTLRTEEADKQAEIKADLDNKRILYMTAPNGEGTDIFGFRVPKVDTRYAISHRFVDAYWSFGPNAIVFMNTCWSGYTAVPHGAQKFMDAVKAKGAGVYLGWTAKVSSPGSEDVPRYLVDRLTMANKYKPENPEERPFFVNEVMSDMRKKGMIPNAGADLVASFAKDVNNVGLRPTIEYVEMDEVNDSLQIYGDFGGQEGELFVDGTKATILSWTDQTIKARIPKSGSGSYGPVVYKVHNKESNARNLTLWSGTFTYTERSGDKDQLQCKVSGTIKFRADLDKRRTVIGTSPKLAMPIPFWAAPGSSCSFQASGEIRDGNNKIVEAWSGSGNPPLVWEPVVGARNAWTANGAYDPTTGELAIGILCGGPKKIQDENGTIETAAGGIPFLSILQQNSFVIPGHAEPGSTSFSVSDLTPLAPPKDQKY